MSDVEATLADALGPQATVSKSTVSRVCQAIKTEFDALARAVTCWASSSTTSSLDGSHFKYHQGAKAEPVLVAWGITTTGKPVLLPIAPGQRSRPTPGPGIPLRHDRQRIARPVAGRLRRGPGLVSAWRPPSPLPTPEVSHPPGAKHPRQGAHARPGQVKAEFWEIFNDIDAAPGTAAQPSPRQKARQVASPPSGGKLYPAAVECLEDDFEHLITYLRFPAEHWDRIRHSNFIERTFGETRRRVKVIGRLPGERSCLSLVWAVLDRASRGWRGVSQSIPSIRLLAELRRELFDPVPIDDEEAVAIMVTPAA